MRTLRWWRAGLFVLIAAWAVASFGKLEVLHHAPGEEAPPILRLLAPVSVGLYAFAAARYLTLYRERRRTLPLAVAVAFVLLAEAMIAVAFGRSWHATWWEWHVLMAIAFGSILFAAKAEYRRERSVAGTFGGLYLERTLERVDRRDSEVLGELVVAMRDDAAARAGARAPQGPGLRRGRDRDARTVRARAVTGGRAVPPVRRPAARGPAGGGAVVRAARRRGEGRDRALRRPGRVHELLGGPTGGRGDRDGERLLGGGRPDRRRAGRRIDRTVRGRRHHGRVQRARRPARPSDPGSSCGDRDARPDRTDRERAPDVAALPDRREHRSRRDRQRGVDRPAELRGDRGHHERRGSSPIGRSGRSGPGERIDGRAVGRRGGRASGRVTVAEREGRGRRGIRAGRVGTTALVGKAGG